jgi:tRNA A-37 threonylcarbamoyl transferase component Bud32
MVRPVPYTVSPAHRERLEKSGLATLEQCRSFQGGATIKALVPGKSTVRLDADGCAYFLKRIEGRLAGEVATEARALGMLAGLRIPVAEVAAVGAEGDFAALVTVGLPVRGTLEQELGGAGARVVSQRSRQVASILKLLHRAGVQHRDFYLTHILVGAAGELYVADFGRARILPRLGWVRRIKDLAALDSSTPPRVASDFSRLLFLRRYTGPVARWRLKILAALARRKSRAMRRHVERSVALLRPNFHAPA